MLELNKTYAWNDIAEKMPNMWAFITDVVETSDGSIDTCKLLDICKAEDKAKIIPKYRNSGRIIQVIRTTENTPSTVFLSWLR